MQGEQVFDKCVEQYTQMGEKVKEANAKGTSPVSGPVEGCLLPMDPVASTLILSSCDKSP